VPIFSITTTTKQQCYVFNCISILCYICRRLWMALSVVKLFMDYLSPLDQAPNRVKVDFQIISYMRLWTVRTHSLLRLFYTVTLTNLHSLSHAHTRTHTHMHTHTHTHTHTNAHVHSLFRWYTYFTCILDHLARFCLPYTGNYLCCRH
jgi:hypothetical protein